MSIPGSASPLFFQTAAADAAAGYQINRSLRFNSGDSSYLGKTFSSAGSTTTWTLSFWIKRVKSGGTQNVFMSYNGSSIAEANYANIEFNNSDQLSVGYAYGAYKRTNRVFRDFSSWYHIVVRLETGNSTASDRVQIYVNGVKETSFAATHDPDLNQSLAWNKAHIHRLASEYNQFYANCYLAEVYFIDGQALAASDFGEYDSNSVWQPKEFTGTYGPLVDKSQNWSSNVTGGSSAYGAVANAFNGSLSNYASPEYSSPMTYTNPSASDTVISTFRVYTDIYTTSGITVQLNDTDIVSQLSTTLGWHTITGFSGDDFSKFYWRPTSGNYEVRLYAIEINGKILVDDDVTVQDNSFYLKFADNSSNAALGTDSSPVGRTLPGVDFDGTNDHVESADHADYSLGTNDFTMEAYIYPRDFDNYKAIMMKYTGTRSTSSWWWSLNSSGHILFYLYYGSSEMGIVTSGTGMTLNKWNHVACVRDGSTARVYINGVQVGTGNISTNSVNDSSTAVRIGEDSQGYYDFDGIISNVRLINGTCLYPSGTTFTAPTTPLTNVTNTKLLCCQSSSSATAATVSPNTLTTSGDPFATTKNDTAWTVNNLSAAYNFGLTKAAQIVGTSKKFSFPFTYTTTLTYEFFVKITTDGTYNYMAKVPATDNWNIGTSGNNLLFGNFTGGWTTFSGTGLNDSEWHFVRLTTTGSSTSLYVDGSLIATNSSGGSVTTGSQLTNEIRGTGSGAFEIAHLRITTGGTPPTTGVPDIATMNEAAGSGGTLAFYDKLDDIASSGTKTSDGGNVTITMGAATVGVTDPNGDSLIDTPTNGNSSDDTGAGGEISGNYCVINPLGVSSNTPTISDGNLKMVLGSSQGTRHGTMGVTSGKWYFEVVYTAASPLDGMVGVANKNHENNLGNYTGGDADSWGYYYNGEKYNNGGQGSYGASWGVNDVMGIALDMDNGALYFSKNGTYQNSGDPTSGSSKTGAAFTNLSGTIFPCINGYGGTQVVNFGQRPFVTSAPSGYKCWNTANLPNPTIADGSTAFDVSLWTGNGGSFKVGGTKYSSLLTASGSGFRSGNPATKAFDGTDGNAVTNDNNGTITFNATGLNLSGAARVRFGTGNAGTYTATFTGSSGTQTSSQSLGASQAAAWTSTYDVGTLTSISVTTTSGSQMNLMQIEVGGTVLIDGNDDPLNHSPDFVWIKTRSEAYGSAIFDIVRGANIRLDSVGTNGDQTITDGLSSFDSNGFTIGNRNTVGENNETYVGWSWDGGTSTASNTDGSITTSVRASQTNGFSIITYTGNGTSGATIGHSLNAEPHWVIVKPRNGTTTYGWRVYHKSSGNTKHVRLDTTSAESVYSDWNNTTPTSSVITLDGSPAGTVNESGTDYLCLAWAPVEGYSSFGSYEGNGSASGPFISTGFKPRWIAIKNVDNYGTGYDWFIFDTTRDTFNVAENTLKANEATAETDSDSLDILSNGFKIRTTANGLNLNNHTHIYAAFAENPQKTARAR